MRFPSSRTLLWSLAICATVAGLTISHLSSGLPEAIILKGIHLTNVRKAWILDGSPGAPAIENYVNATNSASQTFVSTNSYLIKGVTLHGLFAVDTGNFDGKGLLVITKDGQIIWVDRKKGPRIVTKMIENAVAH